MPDLSFRASLSRSQGRSAWSIIFRHPLRQDRRGKAGLRVRRGLGTTNQEEAQQLVDQLNELLSNPNLWKSEMQEEALRRYDHRIVDAFYDQLEPPPHNPWALREHVISFPPSSRRLLLAGTTGAGKTTVVRQLLGTNPTTERFPSTSTAKTTISDLEIILADGPYRAAVTFLTEPETRRYIQECVAAAALIAFDNGTDEEIADRLLEHREQRFRMSYILGKLPVEETGEEDESEDDDMGIAGEQPEISPEERQEFVKCLRRYIADIRTMAQDTRLQLIKALGDEGLEEPSKRDKEAFQELFEDELYGRDDVEALIDRLLDDVRTRFDLLTVGTTEVDADGWPILWTWTTEGRAAFIRTISRFSSNYAPNFGHLLTPLVEGVRVMGPFRPDWNDSAIPPLVLLDGEGLGHTPDSAFSLSTKLTNRFAEVDYVLLVDSAAAPIQAPPAMIIKHLVTTGYIGKLLIGFTHFDLVKGDNLPTPADKRRHVLASLENGIAAICEGLGRGTELSLRQMLSQRVFFLANVQRLGIKEPTREEFRRLITMITPPVAPQEQLPAVIAKVDHLAVVGKSIAYDEAMLMLHIQKAITEFREIWRARLGLMYRPDIAKEHWARVKAFTDRLGYFNMEEYARLRPVADLLRLFATQLYVFLRNECHWTWSGGTEPLDDETINQIAQALYTGLYRETQQALISSRRAEWRRAEAFRGRGSTVERSRAIDAIYQATLPLLNETPNIQAVAIVDAVRQIFRHAAIQVLDTQPSALTVARDA